MISFVISGVKPLEFNITVYSHVCHCFLIISHRDFSVPQMNKRKIRAETSNALVEPHTQKYTFICNLLLVTTTPPKIRGAK